jgi:BirA family biotin operon repressor/biotin-[acetyl-CoA-carboxylase] ligase
VHGAKVAGLLLESAAAADERVGWLIIGSGVNIASAPVGTPYPATALRHEGFPPITPLDLLARYLGMLDGWLARWRAGGFAGVRPAWLALGSGVGDRVRLRLGREEVAGRFLDVTDQGALLVAQDGERRRQITAGELLFVDR